jgi:PKD repeat protein
MMIRKNMLAKNWAYLALCTAICACMLAGILPVSAVPPNTVLPLTLNLPGGQAQTVFLGEQNVQLAGVANAPFQVAYFTTSSVVPEAVVTLNSGSNLLDNFDTASHPEFTASRVGSWYMWTGARGVEMFKLALPTMAVQVQDVQICNNQDRTATTVMNSQPLQFRTGVDQGIGARLPAVMVYDINLADGTFDYPAVNNPPPLFLVNRGGLNPGGITAAINPDIAGPWQLDAQGPNGQYITPPGEYRFNATCMINGLTVLSPEKTLRIVEPSVTVAVNPASVQRGNRATVTISGEPQTDYYFGIIECPLRMTGEVCNRPPWIVPGSAINGTLTFDMTGNEQLVPSCCGGLPFNAVIPPINPADGNNRMVRVTTDCNGIASFLVDSDTDTWKRIEPAEYTLHVQKRNPQRDGTILFHQTQFTLTKGIVTIEFYDASDPAQAPISEAYLGDLIGIRGQNTESAITHLYLTGPCQPECGGSLLPMPYPYGLLGPVPTQVNVLGGSWEFVTPGFRPAHTWWDTSVLPINPGTYTIYALTAWLTGCPGDPQQRCVTCGGGVCNLLNCPNCLVYAVGTITLKEPELDASVNDIEPCCCPGYPCGTTNDNHPIHVWGNATGNTPHVDLQNGRFTKDVNVWLFGQGKVGDLKFLNWREPIPCDGKFNFTIPLRYPRTLPENSKEKYKWDIPLCSLDPGVYDLIIQTHGYNQAYDVIYEDDIPVIGQPLPNRVPLEQNKRWIVTSFPDNAWQDPFTLPPNNLDFAKLVQVEGPGYKLGSEALQALIRGLENPEIDDKYVHVQFTIKGKSCLAGTDFEADRTYGNNPLTVRFTDKTSGTPTSWSWDFGDGTTSTEQNPIHTYTKNGRYTVSLTTDGDDKNKQVKNDLIRVAEGPTAAFNTMPADVTVGTQVQFVDLSTGNPSTWSWEFGDGGTSSLQSPVYVYSRPGSYTVQLTVSDLNGISQTVSKVVTVQGAETPVEAIFTTKMLSSTTVEFNSDGSTGYGINSWKWDFGDGTTSTDKNPTHTYLKEGTYPVTLTVSNGEYSATSQPKIIGIR